MIIVVFATYFLLALQIHRGTPEQDSLPRGKTTKMAETQSEPWQKKSQFFPLRRKMNNCY